MSELRAGAGPAEPDGAGISRPAAGVQPQDLPPVPAGTGGVMSPRYRALTLGSVSVILLIAFEAMAVGTAMPAAAGQLDGVSLYAFAFAGYFTTSLLGMVVSGQWCDRRGPLAPVTVGIGCFSGGLLLSGLAQSMLVLVLGRAAQGVGGGLIIVALYVLVRRAYPEHLRPSALAAFSAAWVVPALVGPVIAGTVTEHLGWRWVFLGITVLVLLPLLVMLPALRRTTEEARREQDGGTAPPFDRRRLRLALAVSAGAGLLQYGGQELRWLSVLPVAAGLALLAPAALRLLPRATFWAGRGLPSVILLRGLVSAAYMVAQTFVPLMLVTQRGLSVTTAGLALAAGGLTWAFGAWLQARPRLEPHRSTLVTSGTVLNVLGIAATPLVLLDAVPVWLPLLTIGLSCFGMGLVVASVGVLVLRLSAPAEAGGNVASLQVCDGLLNVVTLTTVGTAFAALGGGATAASHTADAAATVGPAAFVTVYAAATAAALLAIAVSRRTRVP
ncbi:MFS transporter [Streptomyces aidingensis]|uniref:Predicted arabinose efflux permease, MFS family n=1 Tax=Streptomyces aidingensis TaxID=910347 RepID=A0A1I1REB0_9ACTN|nr:MFS transporter [Streptomyces aidingensis]SFD32629.1 Predicted arabinose efflux permease, MFS family [Streptomyces aidingensis]